MPKYDRKVVAKKVLAHARELNALVKADADYPSVLLEAYTLEAMLRTLIEEVKSDDQGFEDERAEGQGTGLDSPVRGDHEGDSR